MELQGLAPQVRHLVDDSSKVGEARRDGRRVALRFGLNETQAERVAIVVTELANNLVRHGGGGELLLQPIVTADDYSIEILAIDRGAGMADVERCLRDGYSTGGTMGTGLGAVQRLAVEFDIYSAAAQGTIVMARVGSRRSCGRFGAVSVALAGESECGDAWRLALDNDTWAALMIDGIGHGTLAAHAADAVAQSFAAAPLDTPQAVIERAHQATTGTRGAAAACALRRGGTLSYAGIGNICGCLVTPERSQGLVSHNGMLGHLQPRIQQFEYGFVAPSLLVMHSDGISARWNHSHRPDLLQHHPAVIAGLIYRDHARSRDDATVLVIGS